MSYVVWHHSDAGNFNQNNSLIKLLLLLLLLLPPATFLRHVRTHRGAALLLFLSIINHKVVHGIKANKAQANNGSSLRNWFTVLEPIGPKPIMANH